MSKFAVLDISNWREVVRLRIRRQSAKSSPSEENAPRVPALYGDHIFYYPQVDTLSKLSAGKKWKFADIRPDAIVTSHPPNPEILLLTTAFRLCFVPNHNPMNIAEPLALYLSLRKSLFPSFEAPFPGTSQSYTHLQSNISSDQVGRFHIYASLHLELIAGKAFNIADVGESLSWEMVWPGIAQYFGLKGVGPEVLKGEEWVGAQKDRWDSWTSENGLRKKVLDNTCWDFMTTVT
jgi:hypothetical protein